MDKRAYWLWLQHAFPAGSTKPKSIYNRFKNLEEFYEGGIRLWSSMQFISKSDITALTAYTPEQAEITVDYCERMNQNVITPECEEYPQLLWEIPDPPSVLYSRGRLPNFDECLSVAIVGSRKTGDLVISTAKSIGYELSKNGVIVVSGGAIGVDTAAHRGAMESVSPTIAVLGCGLDYPYLMENELLRKRIVDRGGALVTEYPPSMGVQRGTFQARNRIISGLSRGVVIVSATKKSGTMITARRALEQNRDIFAVPGNPLLPTSEGPNNLIKDGAVPITGGKDIIDYYGGTYNSAEFLRSVKAEEQISFEPQEKNYDVSDDAKLILKCLSKTPTHISEIMNLTGLKPSVILTLITELEFSDLVVSYSGQRYSL